MMDSKIEILLEDYCKKDGYEKWENDNELLEILRGFDVLHKELCDEHRHWNEYEYIIKIDDTYLRYIYAETTGDMSAWEAGYEFDPSSICEMEAITKTVTAYIIKKEDKK